jgi:hypothetical protein
MKSIQVYHKCTQADGQWLPPHPLHMGEGFASLCAAEAYMASCPPTVQFRVFVEHTVSTSRSVTIGGVKQ